MIVKNSNSTILGDYELIVVEFKPIIPALKEGEEDMQNKHALIGYTSTKGVILAAFDTEEEAILNLKAIYGLIPASISLDRTDLKLKPVEIR